MVLCIGLVRTRGGCSGIEVDIALEKKPEIAIHSAGLH